MALNIVYDLQLVCMYISVIPVALANFQSPRFLMLFTVESSWSAKLATSTLRRRLRFTSRHGIWTRD